MCNKPDWRNPDHYPKSSAAMEEFTWEFLRRNSDYVSAYETSKELLDAGLVLEGGVEMNFKFWKENNELPMSLYDVDPPAMPNENSGIYRTRVKNTLHSIAISDGVIPDANKFGVEKYVDPNLSYEDAKSKIKFEKNLIRHEHVVPRRNGAIDNPIPVSLSAGEVGEAVILFDVRLPLNKQLADAKEYLDQWKEKIRNGKIKVRAGKSVALHYADQLRILDATAGNVPQEEIAQALFPTLSTSYAQGKPGQRRVRDTLAAAKILQNDPLKLLLLARSKPKERSY